MLSCTFIDVGGYQDYANVNSAYVQMEINIAEKKNTENCEDI